MQNSWNRRKKRRKERKKKGKTSFYVTGSIRRIGQTGVIIFRKISHGSFRKFSRPTTLGLSSPRGYAFLLDRFDDVISTSKEIEEACVNVGNTGNEHE